MNGYSSISSAKVLRDVWDDRRQQLLGACFGPDRVTGHAFQKSLRSNLERIRLELLSDYVPRGLLAFAKPKSGGGNRIICVPTVSDRIVQFCILEQLRPRLKRSGLDNPVSFGLARGRQRSVLGARKVACDARDEHPYVYKTDIHKFFDTVKRDVLQASVDKVVAQRTLRPILSRFLECEIEDGVEPGWRKVIADSGIARGVGIRQGMPLSPFFAGAYLRDLDRWLLKQPCQIARYVDDIVAFFDTESEAREFHKRLSNELFKIGLEIGAVNDPRSKTRIFEPGAPADFLGMQIVLVDGRHRLCVSPKTIDKISEKFARLSTVDALAELGVFLTTLGSYFAAIKCGYLNAYDGAHDFESLKEHLEKMSNGAQVQVLTELFGEKLETMSAKELRFVGVN